MLLFLDDRFSKKATFIANGGRCGLMVVFHRELAVEMDEAPAC